MSHYYSKLLLCHQKVSLSSSNHCWNTQCSYLPLILYREGPTLAHRGWERYGVLNSKSKSKDENKCFCTWTGRANTCSLWACPNGTREEIQETVSLRGRVRWGRRKRADRMKYRPLWWVNPRPTVISSVTQIVQFRFHIYFSSRLQHTLRTFYFT